MPHAPAPLGSCGAACPLERQGCRFTVGPLAAPGSEEPFWTELGLMPARLMSQRPWKSSTLRLGTTTAPPACGIWASRSLAGRREGLEGNPPPEKVPGYGPHTFRAAVGLWGSEPPAKGCWDPAGSTSPGQEQVRAGCRQPLQQEVAGPCSPSASRSQAPCAAGRLPWADRIGAAPPARQEDVGAQSCCLPPPSDLLAAN